MQQKPLLPLLALALVHPAPAQTAQPASAKPAATTPAKADPAWKTAIDARRKQLIDQNGPGTDTALRDQLLQMRSTDQAARGFIPSSGESQQQMLQKLPATDAQLTAQLKQIVAQKGWPTISLVGIDASNAAMLLLTHSPDHAWQLQLLPQLDQLADAGKIDPSTLAFVVDKELVSEGKLQRYGSQFKYVNGSMAMYGVEDPGGLDQQRARALLPPIDVYKQQLSAMYHIPTSNAIISPTPPAPASK
jgi:hypothetical protein